ncbi:MAG: hypothetical protein A3G20_06215 [Acidobacteria bacterium RIFCSPLOWO2_12_FULL_59_11]|nr:MAG: hypothetical protein A3G20_06215 [Acidobacteria bacterium RIFCSPLOWO2_12_FULL_59_11]
MAVLLPIPAIAFEAVMVMDVLEPRLAVRSGHPNLNVLLAEQDYAMTEITVPFFVNEHFTAPFGAQKRSATPSDGLSSKSYWERRHGNAQLFL